MSNESITGFSNSTEYKANRPETQPLNTRKPFRVRTPNPDPEVEATFADDITTKFDELTQNLLQIKAVQEKRQAAGLEVERSKLLTKPRIGQRISGNYIACLEALGIGSDLSQKPSRIQIEAINRLNRNLAQVYPDSNEREITKVGLFGEYATYLAIDEAIKRQNLPLATFKAAPIEDLTAGTDLVLERTDRAGLIPVQIKCMSMNAPDRLLYPIDRSNGKDVVSGILSHSKKEDFGKSQQRERSLQGSFGRLMQFSDENLPVLDRAVLVVPSPQGDISLFNSFNGIPNEEFIGQVGNELQSLVYPEASHQRISETPRQQGIESILPQVPRYQPQPAFGDD